MKFIHTSDWHIGKILNEYNMIKDQEFFLKNLIDYIEKNKIQSLIIAGDIYHRSIPSTESVELVNKVFSKIAIDLKVPIIAISGNHDSSERLGFGNKFFESSNLYIDTKISKNIRKITLNDDFGEINFYTIPYVEPSFVKREFELDKLDTFNDTIKYLVERIEKVVDKSQRNILITHGFFSYINKDYEPENIIFSDSEVSLGGYDIVNAKILDIFDYVALGHLHAPQKVGKDHIRYSGSILKYSVSEANQKKSITKVNIKQKNCIDIEKVYIPTLKDLRVISGDFYEIIDSKLFDDLYSEDYVFVVLKNNKNIVDPAAKLRSIFPNMLGIKFNETIESKEIPKFERENKNKPVEQLFEEFYTYMTNNEPSIEQKNIIFNISNEIKKEKYET